MILWVDDVRKPVEPDNSYWAKSVNNAIFAIMLNNQNRQELKNINYIDIDHDAGEYAEDGGDYIRLLDWLEEKNYKNVKIHIHSMNPVGIVNMRRIIKKNEKSGWKEI